MKNRALTLVIAAGLAIGCAEDNNASVFITAACYPPEPEDGQCTVSDTCELFLTGIPFVDLNTTQNSFVLPLEFRNQLAENADDSMGGTNTNVAFVEDLRFDYRAPAQPATTDQDGDGDVDGNDVILAVDLTDVRAPMTAFSIEPGGTAVAWLELIAPGVGNSLVGSGTRVVTIDVRAGGHYNGGSWFETGSFQIVAEMCRGCAPATSPCAAGEIYTACPQRGQTSNFTCEAP
ncbi:MAG TPA: hypothetical protein VD838_12965 [Anaeromyxobacteraceae bacterium]|nr:hypothetical protein [Anaeromyxobacteraceae bacterium]